MILKIFYVFLYIYFLILKVLSGLEVKNKKGNMLIYFS